MGFDFKKIKNLFVTDVEDNKKPEDTANSGNEVKKESLLDALKNKDTVPPPQNLPVGDGGKLDQKILDSLIKALSDSNLPGEDYMEYAEALKAMETIPLEEKVKIQTVLATLSTRGLTTAKIIDSGKYYIDVLAKEKAKFGKAIEKQMKEGVSVKTDEIAALEALNKTKSTQIAALTKEITDNQAEIEKIKAAISGNQVKIKSTEDNFNVTFDFVVNQLQTNIDKIVVMNPPPAGK
jgi:hypothetical protein